MKKLAILVLSCLVLGACSKEPTAQPQEMEVVEIAEVSAEPQQVAAVVAAQPAVKAAAVATAAGEEGKQCATMPDCTEIGHQLRACQPFECHQAYAAGDDVMAQKVNGWTGDKCGYLQMNPQGEVLMECSFSTAQLAVFGTYLSRPASEQADTTVENPFTAALEDGTCWTGQVATSNQPSTLVCAQGFNAELVNIIDEDGQGRPELRCVANQVAAELAIQP